MKYTAMVTRSIHNLGHVPRMYAPIFPVAQQNVAVGSEFQVLHSSDMRIKLGDHPAGRIYSYVKKPINPSADEHSIAS